MRRPRRQFVALLGILALLLHAAATMASPGGSSGVVRLGGSEDPRPDRLSNGDPGTRPPLAMPDARARSESLVERPASPPRPDLLPRKRAHAERLPRASTSRAHTPPRACTGRRCAPPRPHLRIGPPDSDDPNHPEQR